MVQRNAVEMKSKLTKKRIMILVAIIAAIAFIVQVPMAAITLGMLSTALLTTFFSILALLPVSAVFILTFVGFGAIVVWAFHKRELKTVLFPGSLLLLPALVAAILMVFFPRTEWYFTYHLLLPLSAIMLSIFVGLGAIVVSPSYRKDLRQVLKLITFTSGAIVFSIFFQFALFLLWALQLMPNITDIVTILVIAYLYWPGKKRGLFSEILGPILVLEMALILTISLIIL